MQEWFWKKNPGAKVIVLDKLTYAGNLDNIKDLRSNKNFEFVKGDICDSKIVSRVVPKVDVIINFAAESAVDRSIQSPDDFIKTDIFGAFTLLEAARKSDIKTFVQISTDEVYGEIIEGAFKEGDSLMPRSPYAASKAGADRLAYSYFTTYGMRTIITRSCNNYGPFAFPEKMLPLFVTNILEGKNIPVYGSGKNSREYVHVTDHCKAIELLIGKGRNGEAYNVGSGVEKTILEMADLIISELKASRNVIAFVTDRPGHDKRYAVDTSKINSLGWKPVIDFEKGARETIKWYVEHPEYWKPLKAKLEQFSKGFWGKEGKK